MFPARNMWAKRVDVNFWEQTHCKYRNIHMADCCLLTGTMYWHSKMNYLSSGLQHRKRERHGNVTLKKWINGVVNAQQSVQPTNECQNVGVVYFLPIQFIHFVIRFFSWTLLLQMISSSSAFDAPWSSQDSAEQGRIMARMFVWLFCFLFCFMIECSSLHCCVAPSRRGGPKRTSCRPTGPPPVQVYNV